MIGRFPQAFLLADGREILVEVLGNVLSGVCEETAGVRTFCFDIVLPLRQPVDANSHSVERPMMLIITEPFLGRQRRQEN